MVSDKVEVTTKIYWRAALTWICNENGEYEILVGQNLDHGTVVTMHISDAESAYLSESKLWSMLEVYCSFMPHDIFFEKRRMYKKISKKTNRSR